MLQTTKKSITKGETMYVQPNFTTKKALKEAVKGGKDVTIFQPGPFGGTEPENAKVSVEGPHYPKPHTWYAMVVVNGGKVIKVS